MQQSTSYRQQQGCTGTKEQKGRDGKARQDTARRIAEWLAYVVRKRAVDECLAESAASMLVLSAEAGARARATGERPDVEAGWWREAL